MQEKLHWQDELSRLKRLYSKKWTTTQQKPKYSQTNYYLYLVSNDRLICFLVYVELMIENQE